MARELDWIQDELSKLVGEGLFRRQREMRPLPGGKYLVDGHEVWDFASNDYLGLASDPRVIAAAQSALQSHGIGARASGLVCGRSDLHRQLEDTIAEFEGTEAAILFPTGMAANVGTVAALLSKGDSVFSDRLNHASLIDGCRVSGALLRVYRHDDLAGLKSALQKESAGRKFIVTDAVFSMDGNLAPLPDLCGLAEQFNAAVIVDEAHGTGVFGELGRGVTELQQMEDRVAVRIGTLSKAVGAIGGFVSGNQSLIDFLWNKARTQIYSTALPPAICAAASTAIQIIKLEPQRRVQLLKNSCLFRDQLKQVGVFALENSVGPIVPIVLPSPQAAMQVAKQLFNDGYLVGAIRPPTVPAGTSRLRVSLHTGLSELVLRQFAEKIAAAVAVIQ